jgi:hypothetical protein
MDGRGQVVQINQRAADGRPRIRHAVHTGSLSDHGVAAVQEGRLWDAPDQGSAARFE